jgi:hypothetical protein
MTKLQICNLSLRLLGVARITTANLTAEDNEQARAINDVYDNVLNEVLKSHPWNFALKRANLTELGGTITTWIASGTTNVWQATLTTEPSSVEFDGTVGTEETSVAGCDADYEWYWASNVLYVYSTSDPDTAFSEINAIIPEFEYDTAFGLPSDYLRIVRMEDDASKFVVENAMLLTDEDEAKVLYIAQVTDTTLFTVEFITVFASRLAAEICFSLTKNEKLSESAYKIYLEKLRQAKGIDSQEGTAKRIEESEWIDARE